MSEERKKAYRLFKVAKELNVGSSTLVDHLNEKGFDVGNSPNEKLTSEMYDILLKDFASEKVLKEKAEQIKEQKHEKMRAQDETVVEEQELISAEQLRSGIIEQKLQGDKRVPPPLSVPEEKPEPKKEEKPAVVVEEKKEKEEPKEEETAPKEEEKEASEIKLKVLGKIDLDKVSGKKPKKPAAKKEEKPAVVEEKPEPKPKKEEKTTAPEPEEEKVVAEEKKEEEVVVEKKVEKETPKEDKKEEKDEKESVIKAADKAPKLAGLKVKGKIELPTEKKKKTTSSADGDDDSDKKKRKRKRKRKRATAVSAKDHQNRNAGKKKEKTNKEEPSDKEIQEIIKSTLADINKRAGRQRQKLRRQKRDSVAQKRQAEELRQAEQATELEVTEFITANELANLLNVSVNEIITKCMELGMFVSINQRLEADVITLVAEEYGFTVKFVDVTETVFDEDEEDVDPESLQPRAPIITVMGHVDHGKTSLLDHIRSANVIAGEAGGITQHVAAYEVTLPDGRDITFLDTPGHEAFTAMRARGAKVTDVVIVVIAADDAVMPQTKEAINHAEAAGVPIVFAFNKIDKANAAPDKIREQLSQMNYLVEDWGGKYQCQEISAKSGLGVEDLLEKVLLEAEMLELKANPDTSASGSVIETKLDKGRGVVGTLIVQSGTLKVGDCFVAGVHFGKVKALMDERGNRIKEAGPSQPVVMLGLTGTPQAGDVFKVYKTEQKAKEIANKRGELYRQQSLRQTKHITLDEIARRKAVGDFQELNIIVKGDVDGSIEALSDSLLKLSTEEVQVNIVMKAVGQISESDVLLASASDAVIIGFQVRPSSQARKLAETESIDIRLYSIIYDAINDVKDALEGLLSPEIKEEIMATVEIREVFKISKIGTVGGCMVTDGKIYRNDPVRLIRDGIVIYEGKLSSLKRFKDDVKEVATGFECGLTIENYNDIKVGDVVESYRESEVKRTLE